jgi:hypothetical protein
MINFSAACQATIIDIVDHTEQHEEGVLVVAEMCENGLSLDYIMALIINMLMNNPSQLNDYVFACQKRMTDHTQYLTNPDNG